MIQRHANEVRVLKEQLRKQKEQSLKLERSLREKDGQVSQLKKSVQKYRKVIESKNLGERDQLANKLTSAESALDESNKRARVSIDWSSIQTELKTCIPIFFSSWILKLREKHL